MKFIKKNKKLILLAIILLIIVCGVLSIKNYFSSELTVLYGNRLEGRDKVIIGKETKEKIKDKIKDTTKEVDIRIAGRIIYLTITVNDEVSRDDAKKLAPLVLEELQDAEKNYYDIQILIKNTADPGQFPIIGYKHHAKTSFSWTKDRG